MIAAAEVFPTAEVFPAAEVFQAFVGLWPAAEELLAAASGNLLQPDSVEWQAAGEP